MTSRSDTARSRGAAIFLLAGIAAMAGGPLAAAQGVASPALTFPKGNHYQCYAVIRQPTSRPRTVKLSDQFGTRQVRVLEITRLCNPTTKTFNNQTWEPVDRQLHYVCYRIAQTDQKPRTVKVVNQFGAVTITAGLPQDLCLPTAKTLVQ